MYIGAPLCMTLPSSGATSGIKSEHKWSQLFRTRRGRYHHVAAFLQNHNAKDAAGFRVLRTEYPFSH